MVIIIIKRLRISEGISPNVTQSRVQTWGFEVDKSYKDNESPVAGWMVVEKVIEINPDEVQNSF